MTPPKLIRTLCAVCSCQSASSTELLLLCFALCFKPTIFYGIWLYFSYNKIWYGRNPDQATFKCVWQKYPSMPNTNSKYIALHKPLACRLFPSPLTPSKFGLFPRLKTVVVVGAECCAPNTNGLLLAAANKNGLGCTVACWWHVTADWPNTDCVGWKLKTGADDAPNPNEGAPTAWLKIPK